MASRDQLEDLKIQIDDDDFRDFDLKEDLIDSPIGRNLYPETVLALMALENVERELVNA